MNLDKSNKTINAIFMCRQLAEWAHIHLQHILRIMRRIKLDCVCIMSMGRTWFAMCIAQIGYKFLSKFLCRDISVMALLLPQTSKLDGEMDFCWKFETIDIRITTYIIWLTFWNITHVHYILFSTIFASLFSIKVTITYECTAGCMDRVRWLKR